MKPESHWTERISTYVALEMGLLIFGVVTAVGRDYFAAVVTAMLILSGAACMERWLMPCRCAECGLVLPRFRAPGSRYDSQFMDTGGAGANDGVRSDRL